MIEDDLSPFKDADSIGDHGLCSRQNGRKRITGTLAEITADRESLQRDANELAEVGLPEVGAVVLQAAANALHAHVMHCPYAEDDLHNYQSWQASYRRRHSK